MSRRPLAVLLTLLLASPMMTITEAQEATDPDLAKGIREVRGADFDSAVVTLDRAIRRLSTDKNRAKELARAYLYLSIAYYGMSQEMAAKAKFMEAWKADPRMEIDASEFPPKFLKFLEEARKEASQGASDRQPKKGRSKTVPILLGAGAAAGVGIALAAGGGGEASPATGSTGPAPTPNLTGRWVGTGADGVFITTNPSCFDEFDLVMDLTQTGSTLTGSYGGNRRRVGPNPPAGCPPVGTPTDPVMLTGTVGQGTLSFQLAVTPPATFTGTFTGNRMSGTFTSTFMDQQQTGRWSANRQ
jgi:hypothetical protein